MIRPRKLLALVAVTAAAGGASALAAATAAGAPRPATARPTATTTTQPTRAQIRSDVAKAERSKQLWATFNSCDYRGQDEIGIRGQMPSLPFDSRLQMIVSLEQWSAAEAEYVPLAGAYTLGGKVSGPNATVQNGVTLRFGGDLTVIAHIRFRWLRDGKVLGSTVRVTSGGHRDDAGAPKGYSVETCST